MEKVICDICGTSYPATADQCPICGCEKSADPIMDDESGAMAGLTTAYKPVKGGRFSNSNVKKRNQAVMPVPVEDDYDQDDDDDDYDQEKEEEEDENAEGSNKGLVAILIILIVAILGLIGYLYFNFFAPADMGNKESETATTTAAATTEPTETEEPTIPCTGLEVSDTNVVLDAIGNAWLLNVEASPADTTDKITYVSSDETVVQVSTEGCITAVGHGEAVVTVTCGSVVVECNVTCAIETEATTEATEAPTEPVGKWGLNRTDFTLRIGERWSLYEGEVSTELITFKSKNTSVATISKSGVVTGVGVGNTVVTAEYNGVIYECVVICKAPKTETTNPETKPTETTPPETKPTETTPPETNSGEVG